MPRNPGSIYEVEEGGYAVAYIKEQDARFTQAQKLLVHLYHDRDLRRPVKDNAGQPKIVLKSIHKLKTIGFVD